MSIVNYHNDIVKVTSDGVVTAVNNGWAVITATSLGGNFSASCLIKVGEPAIPDAVNLGLSVPWASFNLGANVPTECGAYFSWGETSPQTTYTWMDYKFCQSWDEYGNIMLSKYNLDSKYGSVDNNDVIDSEDDAATVNLGSEWRMPTAEEWMELQECCTWTWTSVDGVKGMKIESNQEGYTGNWIFLPAAGRWTSMGLGYVGSIGGYWSSSLYGDYSIMAQAYGFANSSSNKMLSQGERYIGASLRPVYVGR